MAILYEIDDVCSRIPGIKKFAVSRGSRSIGEGYSAHVDDRDFLEGDVTSTICICLRVFFDDPVGIGWAEVRAICLRVKCREIERHLLGAAQDNNWTGVSAF